MAIEFSLSTSGEKKTAYQSSNTFISVSKYIPRNPLTALLLGEYIKLPTPHSLYWQKNVSLTAIKNYEQSDYAIETKYITDHVVMGANSMKMPEISASPRYLSIEFVVKNDIVNILLDTKIKEVEDFFQKTSLESSVDVSYDISVEGDTSLTPAISFESFKLIELTVNRSPFKILDGKAFLLKLTFCEAQPPNSDLFGII